MKKYTIFYLLVLLTITSCKKSFIELTDPNAVTIEDSFKTESDVQLYINGTYNVRTVVFIQMNALMIRAEMMHSLTPVSHSSLMTSACFQVMVT
jgi:hypothetical protein